jgi:hypothetical protein
MVNIAAANALPAEHGLLTLALAAGGSGARAGGAGRRSGVFAGFVILPMPDA